MRLRERLAIVTGGASGFGAGIAEKFAAEGARVVVVDRLADPSLPYADGYVQGDVTDPAVWQTLARRFADADIVVNNAGIGHGPTPAEDLEENTFLDVQRVNTHAIYYSVQTFVPLWKTRNRGTMINIASTAGVSPRPGLTWYNASKGWVITATRSLAVELAPFGIRVNAVNPVAGETPLLATFMGGDSEAHRQKFIDTVPLGRLSTPQDVANAACYLASDEASMITGVALDVDGGRVI